MSSCCTCREVLCVFILFNVFIGVIIEQYNLQKESHDGDGMFETKEQRASAKRFISDFILAEGVAVIKSPRPKDDPIRAVFWEIAYSNHFENLVLFLVVVNTLLMATTHKTQSKLWYDFQEGGNTLFVAFFTIEAIIKLYGMGTWSYFISGWNKFDFFLVMVSFLQYLPVLSG